MKTIKLILLLVVFYSFGANAYNQPHGYNQRWQYSSTVCSAVTRCPNGLKIYCTVYGMNYGNVPSYMSNSCRTRVIPGRSVQCQGYAQQVDAWGNYVWASANIPLSCY
ncbi:MAG: hypothetical protein ACJAS4_002903 [Bacteriovoracaceae bacterium]|jgi:hypothetical protein